jgi:hypothetical protein
MKKTIAIISVLVAALSLASAKSLGFTAGIHGFIGEGWGKSWDTETVSSDAKYTDDFAGNMLFGGGLFVNFPLGGTVGIQPEVNFMANSAEYTTSGTGTLLGQSGTLTTKTTYSYNSIDIPVFLSVKYNKFNFLVGPYISLPVTQVKDSWTKTLDYTFLGSTGTTNDSDSSSYDVTSKTLFGLAFGLDYAQRMGGMYLMYGARYMLDFTPVTAQIDDDTTQKLFTRRALLIDLGLRIAL